MPMHNIPARRLTVRGAMGRFFKYLMFLCLTCLVSMPAIAAETALTDPEGTIFTLWPLIDYRESPKDGFSNLAILGPLIKIQRNREIREISVRPFFHSSSDEKQGSNAAEYLYPVASSETNPSTSRFQMLQLFQTGNSKEEKKDSGDDFGMLFPFYISGVSEKYGKYTSVFPIYGDIYERFWRDEYHFFLFPLYGRTVKNGTTSSNYLYPFFNRIEGDRESGGHFWPLYGQSSKEGVYSKRFVLWPFFMQEKSGLNTENPVDKLFIFPLYTSTDSPELTSRGWLWPFFGYSENRKLHESRKDFLWPLWWTVRGENRHVDSILPFYFNEERKDSSKQWFLWPIYRYDIMDKGTFSQERHRVLFFLYQDRLERWARDGSERRRTSLWPLFMYKRDNKGVSTLTLPALVEPIIDREAIDNSWGPLWRIYVRKWNDSGESAVSFLWNLYWHESRKESLAYELFPLVFHRDNPVRTETSILKGLFSYRSEQGEKRLNLLWLPFGLSWGEKLTDNGIALRNTGESL